MKRILFATLAALLLMPGVSMAADYQATGPADDLFVCTLADTGDPTAESADPLGDMFARGSDEHLLKPGLPGRGGDEPLMAEKGWDAPSTDMQTNIGDMYAWLRGYDGPKRGVDQQDDQQRHLSSVDPTMHINVSRTTFFVAGIRIQV